MYFFSMVFVGPILMFAWPESLLIIMLTLVNVVHSKCFIIPVHEEELLNGIQFAYIR